MSTIIDEELQYHLKIKKGDIGRYVILPGDPGRVEKIAEYFDDAKQVSYNREYNIYTGFIDGVKVSCCSTGIGGPSSAIAVEELIKCGADTFIRIGTSGGMNKKVYCGDLVIANAAIRCDGTSKEYLPITYPAVSNFYVTKALSEAAEEISTKEIGNSFHIGVVQSKDNFYGQVSPDTMPISNELLNNWSAYLKGGCLASEMECSTVYSVALSRGVRAGGVLVALWNVEHSKHAKDNEVMHDTSRGIKCAVLAIRKLIEWDGK